MATMRIWVFDVEHGSMAFVRSPGGATLTIDCGCTSTFSPSRYVHTHELTQWERDQFFKTSRFVVTHPHDDHIEDITTFDELLHPANVMRQIYNWNGVIQQSGADYSNLQTWVNIQQAYNQLMHSETWGGLEVRHWMLTPLEAYAVNAGKFVNNSSIVTIVRWGGFKIVFPGDIEADGWIALLRKSPDLGEALQGTSVFVTSHHGHSSGYEPTVFDSMGKPFFNLSSVHSRDLSVDAAYSSPNRALGVIHGGVTRYHFTTRYDGSCLIRVNEDGSWDYGFYKLVE